MKRKLNKTRTLMNTFGKHLRLPKLILLFIITLIFQNCVEPTEGCLDIRATNFDVTAAKACDTKCTCTYPSLIVSTEYYSGTSGFNYNTDYTNDVGQKFRIVSAQLYLSDFQLVDNKNKTYKTIDSVAISRATDTINVLKNYALIGKSNGFDFTIGSFNGVGNFTKIKFRVGLDDVAAKAIPSKMQISHPLSIKADSMYISSQSQYIFNKFVIAKGTNFKDTLRLNIITPTDLEFSVSKTFKEGYDVKIPLAINYLTFFSGVDFSQTENQIMTKVVNNTSKSLSIQ